MRNSVLALLVIMLVLVGTFVAVYRLIDLGPAVQASNQANKQAAVPALPVIVSPVTVHPAPVDMYLTNPGIGWQHFEDVGDPLLPETVLYPDRKEISWDILNPGDGVYDWDVLDNFFAQATAEGKQIAFRIYTMRKSHRVPAWVLEHEWVLLPNGEPDYSNCTYQAEWARLVDALRARYDGNPQIAFIDISGYGNYNEWSWQDSQTEWDNNALKPRSLDGQARRRLADMFIGGSNRSHKCRTAEGEVETVAYDYAGFEQTQLVMPYAGIRQSTEYVVDRRDDVGIRFDCLGNRTLSDGLLEKIGEQIEQVWPHAPVVFEFCSRTTTEPAYIQEAEALLQAAHGSLVHDNLSKPRETAPVERLVRPVGYRFELAAMTYSSAAAPGGELPIVMKWRNTGYAPAYTRMGQDFELHLALVNDASIIVLDQIVETAIAEWLPAADTGDQPPLYTVVSALDLPPDLPPGRYNLRVSMVDRRTEMPVNLAFEGRDGSGWYRVGSVDIQTNIATPTPVP